MSRICTINRSRYLATSPRRPIAKRSTKVVRYIITEAPVPPEASEEPKLQDGNQHSVKQARQQEPSRTLPLSPLMDPAMIEAREKWKKPKPVASKQKTKLQRQLEVNPYGTSFQRKPQNPISLHTELSQRMRSSRPSANATSSRCASRLSSSKTST